MAKTRQRINLEGVSSHLALQGWSWKPRWSGGLCWVELHAKQPNGRTLVLTTWHEASVSKEQLSEQQANALTRLVLRMERAVAE